MTDLDQRGSGRLVPSAATGGTHYDKDQPRVPAGDPSHHGGQWTKEGGYLGRSSPLRIPAPTPPPVPPVPAPPPAAGLGALGAVAPLAAGLGAFALGMTSFSSTAGNVQEGSLRHYPDIRYRYDEGFLTVYGPFEDGKAPLLFQGRADDDGLFRLPNGAIVAGDKKPGVVLNEYGIASIRERSREGLRAYYAAQRGDDDPKLCPDPTPERPTRDKNKFTVIWRVYQHQVTGVPYGYAVDLHGVEFDGCILIDGTGQETKALGFRKFIEGEEFKRWFSGRKAIVKQLSNQSRVAALDGRMVVWYVAEEEMVAMVARLIEQHGLNNVFVTHRPFVPPKAGL